MTAMTRAPCSTTWATRTSSTRSDTPKWRPTGSRTFGGIDSGQSLVSRLSWGSPMRSEPLGLALPPSSFWLGERQVGKALRLAPRTRFAHRLRNPFDNFRFLAEFLIDDSLQDLDRSFQLLIRHRLNAALVCLYI